MVKGKNSLWKKYVHKIDYNRLSNMCLIFIFKWEIIFEMLFLIQFFYIISNCNMKSEVIIENY